MIEGTLRDSSITAAARQILDRLQQIRDPYLVGIAGIPGSGKTTLCRTLQQLRPESIVLPMDGYHIPRSQLDVDGLFYRGAMRTFDAAGFRRDLSELKRTRSGRFPEFNHAEKDPRYDAIRIESTCPLVFVEGIYVLMKEWNTEPFFDLKVFLDCELNEATERLAVRHFETGLADSIEAGRSRALINDRVNSLAILRDGCRERADLIVDYRAL